MTTKKPTDRKPDPAPDAGIRSDRKDRSPPPDPKAPVPEIGGRGGLDPTRYGDWEKNGRCIDF